MSSPTRQPQRLVLLDGLRGLAALSVMLMHDAMAYGEVGPFARAYLSVDLFFLLSGFVLALAFERKFAAGMGPTAFMRLRIVRLWPVLAFGMVLGMIMTLFSPQRPILGELIASNFLLLPLPLDQGLLYMLNAPAWSLVCELFINWLHVLVLWRLSNGALLRIAACGGVMLAGTVIYFGLGDLGAGRENWIGGYFRILFAYPIGIYLARRWSPSLTGRVNWIAALALPILFMVGLPYLPGSLAAVDTLAMLIGLPLLFALATRAEAPARAAPALSWLGAISYPVYAYNWPLIYLAVHATADMPPDWQLAARIAALAATVGLAHLTVEAAKWRKARWPAQTGQTTAAPA